MDCPAGNAYKVSVTGLAFYVIWYDKHSADWLAALASPYPASPDFSTGKRVTRFSGRFASLRIVFPCHPCSGGRIDRSMLSCRDMAPWLSTHSAPACGGKVVAPATKGGMHFHARQGGCMVFTAKGGIKIGAEGAVPPQWNGTSYLPRAEPSTRPGGVSRSRTEPLAPRAKGPAAPSTLTPVRACQPSGILESTPRSRSRSRPHREVPEPSRP